MKKILTLVIICFLAITSVLTVNAEEIPNIVDDVNSGFEGITAVQETDWFKLHDAYGSSRESSQLYNNITIKTNGGHSGNNYISASLEQSWFSPSINIYPFIKEAGADAYVICFWYKSNKNIKITRFIIRALEKDAYESGEFMPDITSRGNGNYYGELKGKSTDADRNGWRFFVSDPFEVVDEQFDGDHNWWFCFDQLSASKDAPLVIDIDDFAICTELDFEMPEALIEKDIVTDITYITDDVVSSAIKADTDETMPIITPSPTPELTPEVTVEPEKDSSDPDFTLPIIVGVSVFVFAAVLISVILVKRKKE